METWELVAREQIRDTLARYNWSGDAGALDGLAETFCPDGVLEIRGFDPLRGRSAIAEFLGGVTGRSPSTPTSLPTSLAASNRLCAITSRTCCSPK